MVWLWVCVVAPPRGLVSESDGGCRRLVQHVLDRPVESLGPRCAEQPCIWDPHCFAKSNTSGADTQSAPYESWTCNASNRCSVDTLACINTTSGLGW